MPHVVRLDLIESSTSFVKLPIDSFLQPHYKGKDYLTGPTYCFFMQHPSGKHILFDLGIRKDWENLSPVLVDNFKKKKWELGAEKNIAEILMENGVDVAKGDIDTVIWSHRKSSHPHVHGSERFPYTQAKMTLTNRNPKRPLGPHRRSSRHLPPQHPAPRRSWFQIRPSSSLPNQRILTPPPTRLRRPRRPRNRHSPRGRRSQNRPLQRIRLFRRREFLPPRYARALCGSHMRTREDDTRHVCLHGRGRITSWRRVQAIRIPASPQNARSFAYSEDVGVSGPSFAGYPSGEERGGALLSRHGEFCA